MAVSPWTFVLVLPRACSYPVRLIRGQVVTTFFEERHPKLTFYRMAAERLELPGQTFDYIILSDLVGYLYDIRGAFERLAALSHPGTRVVIHWYSRLWQPVVHLLERLGLKCPLPFLNWTTVQDIQNLLRLAGFETIRERGHILLPLRLGALSRWATGSLRVISDPSAVIGKAGH